MIKKCFTVNAFQKGTPPFPPFFFQVSTMINIIYENTKGVHSLEDNAAQKLCILMTDMLFECLYLVGTQFLVVLPCPHGCPGVVTIGETRCNSISRITVSHFCTGKISVIMLISYACYGWGTFSIWNSTSGVTCTGFHPGTHPSTQNYSNFFRLFWSQQSAPK